MFLANVLGSVIRGTKRIVQVSLFKKAREIPQALPYGVDSAPVREMVAVYANTADMGNSVIVGYVYKDAVAEVGSIRLYSENGYVYLRANGNLELLGTADNAMRYAAFNSVIQSYLTTLNLAISTGVSSAGGAYTPPTAPNFTAAKINEIKTL
jgi:hypothetical protein